MGNLSYNRMGDIVEITIRDFSGAKIETFTCNMSDKKKYSSILRFLKDKYGFEPEIDGNFSKEITDSQKDEDFNWF